MSSPVPLSAVVPPVVAGRGDASGSSAAITIAVACGVSRPRTSLDPSGSGVRVNPRRRWWSSSLGQGAVRVEDGQGVFRGPGQVVRGVPAGLLDQEHLQRLTMLDAYRGGQVPHRGGNDPGVRSRGSNHQPERPQHVRTAAACVRR